MTASDPNSAAPADTPVRRALIAARGAAFVGGFFLWAVAVMGPVQRLVIWPLTHLRPRGRERLIRRWMHAHARGIIGGARRIAGLHVSVEGEIPAEPCVIVMNHQSVVDVPLVVGLIPGPYPRFPVRQRYTRGIPGLSPLMRMIRCIPLAQGETATRQELRQLTDAADSVAAGENSLVIFPEGHRTLSGEIEPFMRSGLRLILARARQRPVYVVVVDGLWRLRTFTDTALRLGGARVTVRIEGPFAVPERKDEINDFITGLEERMRQTLAAIRGHSPLPAPRDEPRRLAR